MSISVRAEIGALNTIRMDDGRMAGSQHRRRRLSAAARRPRRRAGGLPRVDSRRRRIGAGRRGGAGVTERDGHGPCARSRACRASRGARRTAPSAICRRRAGQLGSAGQLHADRHASAHRSHAGAGERLTRRACLRPRLQPGRPRACCAMPPPAGCQTIGGLDMLVAQAHEQFRWWTGVAPSAAVMRAAAHKRLSEFRTDEDHVV